MNTQNNSPVEHIAALFQRGGKALWRTFRDQQRPNTRIPVLPTLRGTPSDRDLTTPWQHIPRTLLDRLRLGSRLADLEPTVDNSYVFALNGYGRRTIIARHRGIKGWLKVNCPAITYSTAMQYKVLAARLRRACGIEASIPLEWLLPDCTEDLSVLSSAILQTIRKGRKQIAAILASCPTLAHLKIEVEKRLEIVRIPKHCNNFYSICERGKHRRISHKTIRQKRTEYRSDTATERAAKSLAAAETRRAAREHQKWVLLNEHIRALHRKKRKTHADCAFLAALNPG